MKNASIQNETYAVVSKQYENNIVHIFPLWSSIFT